MFVVDSLRYGFATNSSSSHSVIFLKDIDDDYYCNFDRGFFTVASKELKTQYVAAILASSLGKLPMEYQRSIIKDWLGLDIKNEVPYIDHQSLINLPSCGELDVPDYQFFQELKEYILQDELVILGGSDEDNYRHPYYNENAKYIFDLGLPCDGNHSTKCVKDPSGYWALFDKRTGKKVRIRFGKSIDLKTTPTKSYVPELIDMKITDYCPYGCKFCYQSSTTEGKHATMSQISDVLYSLYNLNIFEICFGGGEPTLHPEFLGILQNFHHYDFSISYTTKNLSWFSKKEAKKACEYTSAFAYSLDVNKPTWKKELKTISKFGQDNKVFPYVHLVMGTFNHKNLPEYLKVCGDLNCNVTLLGYKQFGFGVNFKSHNYDDWLDIIAENQSKYYCNLGIDTILAEQSKESLVKNEVPDIMVASPEGKFSCYIDTVNQYVSPSSFSEEKYYFDHLNEKRFVEFYHQF